MPRPAGGRTLSAGQVTGRENQEAVMGSAEVQGELWGWHPQTWAKFQESQMRPLYDATLDGLEPLAGRALLDAGCGAGLAVRMATDRGAVVSGLDAPGPLPDRGAVRPAALARPAAARHARAAGGQRPRRGREPAGKGGPDRDRRRRSEERRVGKECRSRWSP